MTDQELLERAARAAGLEIELYTGDGPFNGKLRRRVIPEPPEPGSKWRVWNPLEDEGDAFRLMCSLGMNVDVSDDVCSVTGWYGAAADEPIDKAGRSVATCRAIVRVAAIMAEDACKSPD
ncbi:hypothetical protein [Vreelandella aquamarina]|uniref:Phage ABA sandwich domain-containing protein n=1 Tax=Vreelandella aquamarina TaxID=77097 RepID=A0A857GL28_9GAMM|nr:hypothetical protein [Halomonas meridiana]QHD50008.1 hypothetical protein CTT34_10055 [Halomonas meridiana]